ncbi:MAG: hypothetical protein RR334_03490 [Clostridia bacterium]
MNNIKNKKMCELDDTKVCDNCRECEKCDLDPTKICDNCGKCISSYKTDEKGFVTVKVDKVDLTGLKLKDLLSAYGLDDLIEDGQK